MLQMVASRKLGSVVAFCGVLFLFVHTACLFSVLVVPYVFPVQAWLELDYEISLHSSMCTVHSMSVCRKVSGMSVFSTFQLCINDT